MDPEVSRRNTTGYAQRFAENSSRMHVRKIRIVNRRCRRLFGWYIKVAPALIVRYL
jgi:hypothetical protein